MSIFGTPGPLPTSRSSSVEGASTRKAARRVKPSSSTSDTEDDGDSVEVHTVEELDGAKKVAGSGEDQSKQDRRQNGAAYRPTSKPDEPSLDLQG